MAAGQQIAEEVGRYLRAQPAPQAGQQTRSRAARGAAADVESTRGLGEPAGGITGWIWRRVEPLVKQQVCTEDNYAKLKGITADQLVLHIDDILTPLTISITDRLPALLKFLAPYVPPLRNRIARVIAQELQRAGAMGWATYCGAPPRT